MSRLIHPRPSRSWAVLVVGAAAVTWPACGGTSSGGDDAGLVERGLDEIPIEVIEAGRSGTAPVFVEVTDLSAVAEVRGLDAPAPGRDAGDVGPVVQRLRHVGHGVVAEGLAGQGVDLLPDD